VCSLRAAAPSLVPGHVPAKAPGRGMTVVSSSQTAVKRRKREAAASGVETAASTAAASTCCKHVAASAVKRCSRPWALIGLPARVTAWASWS